MVFARNVRERFQRNHRRRAAIRTLMALDDRLLNDIGLPRGRIREVADQLAARASPAIPRMVNGRVNPTPQGRPDAANRRTLDSAA
ncbi:MAG: DUF1127 domain-containing protein [Gammaproteobacteria bacterium]|nr:DUF1127 domain-containing protein [Gammaproteobacteria bacterium]